MGNKEVPHVSYRKSCYNKWNNEHFIDYKAHQHENDHNKVVNHETINIEYQNHKNHTLVELIIHRPVQHSQILKSMNSHETKHARRQQYEFGIVTLQCKPCLLNFKPKSQANDIIPINHINWVNSMNCMNCMNFRW